MMLRIALCLLLAGHGLIHLMGFAKAFGLAEMPQLREAISRPVGLLWLVAAVLVLAAAGAFLRDARAFFVIAAVAAVVSQAAIATSWSDARFGTIANVLLAALAAAGFFANGPGSLRARYEQDVAAGFAGAAITSPVTEAELAMLPLPVQRYLRMAGVVGQPHVHDYRVHMRGRIRSSAKSPWMPLDVEQSSFTGPPARLFFLRASMFGLPVTGLHRYVGPHASMTIKLLGAIPVVAESGDVMDQSETVTLFNDMCILAPATLLDPAIRWSAAGADTVGAEYTNAGHTIHARLVFNDKDELVNFISDDRSARSADGKSFLKQRWTTPVGRYKDFGAFRLSSAGEARYEAPEGAYAYVELEFLDVAYNVARP